MATLKDITELPLTQSAEGIKLIVNDNGAAKQTEIDKVLEKVPQADWAVTDETNPSFVKNKPFYTGKPEKKKVYQQTTLTFETSEDALTSWVDIDTTNFILEENLKYLVYFDGKEYELYSQYFYYGTDVYWLGNPYIFYDCNIKYEDNGVPFCIAITEFDGGIGILSKDSGEHSVEIFCIYSEVYKIEPKYIDTVKHVLPSLSKAVMPIISLDIIFKEHFMEDYKEIDFPLESWQFLLRNYKQVKFYANEFDSQHCSPFTPPSIFGDYDQGLAIEFFKVVYFTNGLEIITKDFRLCYNTTTKKMIGLVNDTQNTGNLVS